MEARRDYDGVLTLLEKAPKCAGGNHEVDVLSYFTRNYKLSGTENTEKVRVGYHCSICSSVVVDGELEGQSIR